MSNDITRVTCVKENCGTFPMDDALYRKLKRSGETWTCPAGHPQHFTDSPESELRGEIDRLKQELNRYKQLVESRGEAATGNWEMYREEKSLRQDIQREILPAVDGVVEVQEDVWLWGCSCGGAARSTFDDESDAKRGLQQHRRKSCDADKAVVEA